MPYIEQRLRDEIDASIVGVEHEVKTPGDLNYLITRIALKYLTARGESYQFYNDVIGALEGAKLELYARKVRKYEDLKIKENGDII